jgi:hypothetical protein
MIRCGELQDSDPEVDAPEGGASFLNGKMKECRRMEDRISVLTTPVTGTSV